MGNKTSQNKIDENDEILEEIKRKITNFTKSDKRNFLDINKTFKPKKDNKFQSCNLKEYMESHNILDFCLDLSSNLFTKSINHEVSSSIYNAILIAQIFENKSNSENLTKDNNMIIDWIYKTHLNKNVGKFDNWIPEIKERNLLDKLENFSSIHAQTEVNLSSYDIDGKVLPTKLEEHKIEEVDKKFSNKIKKDKEKEG